MWWSSSSPMRVDRTCLRQEGKLFEVSLMGKWVAAVRGMVRLVAMAGLRLRR
ncbi:hypothetical protein HanRHA438_Chr03g0147601 [Helianthus annuus]|nr:hypothetical protein HanRHA438_Chr03g0147601 [Helianthus annuus]